MPNDDDATQPFLDDVNPAAMRRAHRMRLRLEPVDAVALFHACEGAPRPYAHAMIHAGIVLQHNDSNDPAPCSHRQVANRRFCITPSHNRRYDRCPICRLDFATLKPQDFPEEEQPSGE